MLLGRVKLCRAIYSVPIIIIRGAKGIKKFGVKFQYISFPSIVLSWAIKICAKQKSKTMITRYGRLLNFLPRALDILLLIFGFS
jgi:hypothetical protein